MSDTLTLCRPWAGHPAGTILGTEAVDSVLVVDALRLQTLREQGYDQLVEAAIEAPPAVPQPRRKGARHG